MVKLNSNTSCIKAFRQGEVRIRRDDGQVLVIRPEPPAASPLAETLKARVARKRPSIWPEYLSGDKGYTGFTAWNAAQAQGDVPALMQRGRTTERIPHPAARLRRWMVERCHRWINRLVNQICVIFSNFESILSRGKLGKQLKTRNESPNSSCVPNSQSERQFEAKDASSKRGNGAPLRAFGEAVEVKRRDVTPDISWKVAGR